MSATEERQLEREATEDPERRRRLRRRRKVLVSPILLVVLVLLVPALWAGVRGLTCVREPEAFAKYAGTGAIGMIEEQAPGTLVAFGL